MAKMVKIHCKRAYEPPASNDGYRLLVDALWPRGVAKASLQIDEWDKELSPSSELRKWFGHEPRLWAAFYQKYHHELRDKLSAERAAELLDYARDRGLTLVYAAKDERHNNAVALKMYLESDSA